MAKFSVGDKVRVDWIDDDDILSGIEQGDTGIIQDVSSAPYVWFDRTHATWAMMEKQMSLIEQDKTVGDTATTFFTLEKDDNEDVGSAATSKHYNAQAIQPIELMEMSFSRDEFKGFLKGNILKYSMRAGSKSGESVFKDTVKAKQYKMWLDLAQRGIKIDPRVHIVIKEK